MKLIFTLTALTFISLTLSAQEKFLKGIPETQELSKKVVKLFNDNKISESFKELGLYWPLPQNELESIEEKTIKYMNLLHERFGDPLGIVKVNNETINDFAIRETYFIRYEHTAIRLKFTYYKNDKGWILNAFKWDDSFSEEFK